MSARVMQRSIWGLVLIACGVQGPSLLAQDVLEIDPNFACAAQPAEIPSEAYLFDSTQRARKAIDEIIEYLGLRGSKIELRASNVPNALAYLDPVTQKRLILYNEAFVDELQGKSQSVWAHRAILAHELAHHLENHLQIVTPQRRRVEELEADRFAGHFLFKLDADLGAVVGVFENFEEGEGYPPRSARVAAATNGWQKAKEQSAYRPGTPVAGDDEGQEGGPWAVDDLGGDEHLGLPSPQLLPQPQLFAQQLAFVPHAAGLAGGPGVAFQLEGSVQIPAPGTLQVVVVFTFPDGTPLFPHPQEHRYIGPGNQLATGSAPRPVAAGVLDLADVAIDPIPHYALNLVPSGNSYPIRATARVVVNQVTLAVAVPADFAVQW